MSKHSFQVANVDTDSFSCTDNGRDIPDFIRKELLKELNSQFPKNITWEDDGYYHTVIVLKGKTYVLWDGEDLIIKGSALKNPSIELALREFINEIIWSIIKGANNYTEIYNKYVKEIGNIQDINRWSTRKTISSKTLESKRTNEAKIRDAIEGTEYVEGARIWVYFTPESQLQLVERFDGRYDKDILYQKLYKAALRFTSVLSKEYFINYSLKKNKVLLSQL